MTKKRMTTPVGPPPLPDGQPFTIAMVNRKGGCAKTGSCHQLSGCFAHMGYRVLLVDMDPQASLTQGFFGPAWTEALSPAQTVLALFDDRLDPDPARVLLPTPVERITILPGANSLDDFNIPPHSPEGQIRQNALKSFLAETAGQFDVTIIDCPPNLNLCSWSALLAADFVMVPLQAEDFGAQGITHVQRAIDSALEKYNPRLRMLGYLVTLRQRLAIHDAYEKQLRTLYGEYVFTSVFPAKKDFKEAIANRRPLHALKPKCAAAKDVQAIAEEILRRVADRRQQSPEFLHFENRAAVNGERKAVGA